MSALSRLHSPMDVRGIYFTKKIAPLQDMSVIGPFVHEIFNMLNGGLPVHSNFSLQRIEEIFVILENSKCISSQLPYRRWIDEFEWMSKNTHSFLSSHSPIIVLEMVRDIIWTFGTIQNNGTVNQIKGRDPVYCSIRIWIRNANTVKDKWNETIVRMGEAGYVGSSFANGKEEKIYLPIFNHLLIPDIPISV